MKGGEEYRIVEYDGRWLAEKLKSPGIWKILGDFASKGEAAKKIEENKGGKNE